MGKKNEKKVEVESDGIVIPDHIVVDPNEFDIDDIIDLEDVGIELDGIEGMDVSQMKGRMLRGFLWVILRKYNPGMTLEQAGKVKVAQIGEAFSGGSDDVDPPDADSSQSE